MPYKIFSEKGEFCIYKHDGSGNKVGSTHGCHPSRPDAVKQLRALYWAEGKEYDLDEKARADLKPEDFLVVEDPELKTTWHLPITKTPGGEPDRGMAGAAHAALFSPSGFRGKKYEGPKKGEAQKRLKSIYSRMGWPWPGEKEMIIHSCPTCMGPVPNTVVDVCPSCGLPVDIDNVRGIKAFELGGERYLVLWTSNAFQDREKEIFKTKAWEDYVARRDARGKYDRVWFWHSKGTGFADIVWEDVVGRMLVDVARLDHTQYADKMWHAINHPDEFPEVVPLGWGTSHGYAYRMGDKQDGVYDFVEKFETTLLPYHRASNLWGGVKEVLDMAVTKEKADALAKLVGPELAEQTLKDAEKATSVLEQAGISFKEDGADEEEDVAEEDEEEAEGTGEELYELEVTDELVKEIASKVDIATATKEAVDAQVKGLKEAILAELTPIITNAVNQAIDEAVNEKLTGQKEQIVQQALSGKISLKPWSASRSNDTSVPDDMMKQAKEAGSHKKQRDVVAEVVSNMLAGRS